jgi:peptide/nickel transport system permease protein
VLLLLILSFAYFAIAHITPGGICSLYPDQSLPACTSNLGLHASVPVQYGDWIGGYLHGDLGQSKAGSSVTAAILGAVPITTLLVLGSYLLVLLLTFVQVMFVRRRSRSGRLAWLARTAGTVAVSVPAFWLGLMAIYFFAVHLRLLHLPAGQVDDNNIPAFWSQAWFSQLGQSPNVVLDNLLKHLFLPAVVLAVVIAVVDGAVVSRVGSVSRVGVLRAHGRRGFIRRRKVFAGAFSSSFSLSLARLPIFVSALIAGFLVVEAVFGYSGLGYLFYTSLGSRDYGVVLGLLMVGSLALILMSLASDLLTPLVSPMSVSEPG